MSEIDSLIVEQLSRIAADIGGAAHYREYLKGARVIDRQWTALSKDDWHVMMSTSAGPDVISLQALCSISECFGANLVVAPLMNVAIAYPLLEPILSSQAIPVIVPSDKSGKTPFLPALCCATHAVFIDYETASFENLVELDQDRTASVLYPEGQRRPFEGRPTGHTSNDAQRSLDALILTAAAELSGIADSALRLALEHIKTRQQFRRVIGSFQALQHRAADSMIAVQEARSLTRQIAQRHDDASLPAGLSHAALSKSIEVAFNVCSSSIQMLGAIGFTAEHDAGLYLKRTMEITRFYGPAAVHRLRFANAAAR